MVGVCAAGIGLDLSSPAPIGSWHVVPASLVLTGSKTILELETILLPLSSEYRDCRGSRISQQPGLHDIWHCSTSPRAEGCLMCWSCAEVTMLLEQ